MSNDFEMEDLAEVKSGDGTAVDSHEHDAYEADATFSLWAWNSTVLLFLLASCLILSPRLLLFLSETASSTERRTTLTPLESFLALHFGIFLCALSAALVLNIPSTSPITLAPHERHGNSHPLLIPLGTASTLSAFLSYNTTKVGSLATIFFLGSTVIALWSVWVIMFAGSELRSKKTGADKHTSAFMFGNKSAASSQKKEWRKEHKAEGKLS